MSAPARARLRPPPWQPGDPDPHAPTGTCHGRCEPGSECPDCGWDTPWVANPSAKGRAFLIRIHSQTTAPTSTRTTP